MQFSILRRFWCTLSAVPLSIGAGCRPGAVLSGRGAVVQHDGKNLFCALFLIFSKNFSTLKTPYLLLFSPVLRTPTRACVFIISEKRRLKIFLKKPVDIRCTRCYTVYTVKERHPAGRLDRDGVHRIGRGARPV